MEREKEPVRIMFNRISEKYDFLNHFLSFGTDRLWRKRLVRDLLGNNPHHVLDVATGTGDLAITLRKQGKIKICGIDIAEQMLEIAKAKVSALQYEDEIEFSTGDAEHIPFPDRTFDAVMVAFGVRNFGDLSTGLKEMYRVLRKEGKVYILEFSHPESFPLKQLYRAYSRWFIPAAGRLISSHPTAYQYLPDTVAAFPSGGAFLEILQSCGFSECRETKLSGGIATIYQGQRKF